MKKLFKLIVLFMGLIAACDDQVESTPVDFGYDYYPINSSERIYQVEKISFNAFGADTLRFLLKEYISDSLVSEEGEVAYVLNREISDLESSEWELDSVWSVRKTEQVLIILENNIPFVKLVYPVQGGRTWDYNAFNTRSVMSCSYEEADVSESMASLSLIDPIKVIIRNVEANLVEQDQRFEVYSRGIGLVQKDYIRVNFCTVACDSAGQIQGGEILRQYLINYVEK